MVKKIRNVFQSVSFMKVKAGYALGIVSAIAIMCCSSPVYAQLESNAWKFKTQNRASIAALMQQVENADRARNATTVSSGASGFDQLVCAGDAGSTATGNSTCIILNNSDGAIQIGQDAPGSQNATSTEDTTMNGLSDVLETINEE